MEPERVNFFKCLCSAGDVRERLFRDVQPVLCWVLAPEALLQALLDHSRDRQDGHPSLQSTAAYLILPLKPICLPVWPITRTKHSINKVMKMSLNIMELTNS